MGIRVWLPLAFALVAAVTALVVERGVSHLVVISARGGRFYTRAESFRSHRGRAARLERRTGRGWRPVARVRLGRGSAVRFSAPLPIGRSRVRVVVEAIPGYDRGVSRAALIRR